MSAETVMAVVAAFALLLSLLGWAYQLGFFAARVSRSEKDIAELKEKDTQIEKDFRTEVREGFGKLYAKIDELPCHNPGWGKDKC
jgi:hypothetical protein